MLLLDVFVTVGVIGIVILGGVAVRNMRRKANPKIQGAENADKETAIGMRRCGFCRKVTNPTIDIYMRANDKWYHRSCYNQNEKNKDSV